MTRRGGTVPGLTVWVSHEAIRQPSRLPRYTDPGQRVPRRRGDEPAATMSAGTNGKTFWYAQVFKTGTNRQPENHPAMVSVIFSFRQDLPYRKSA